MASAGTAAIGLVEVWCISTSEADAIEDETADKDAGMGALAVGGHPALAVTFADAAASKLVNLLCKSNCSCFVSFFHMDCGIDASLSVPCNGLL